MDALPRPRYGNPVSAKRILDLCEALRNMRGVNGVRVTVSDREVVIDGGADDGSDDDPEDGGSGSLTIICTSMDDGGNLSAQAAEIPVDESEDYDG